MNKGHVMLAHFNHVYFHSSKKALLREFWYLLLAITEKKLLLEEKKVKLSFAPSLMFTLSQIEELLRYFMLSEKKR